MKIIIIGGVAGGATTAARLRRNDEKAEILLIERSSYISYANCGLPYYIGDVINEREKIFVQTPEAFKKRFNIDVRINSEAIKIDRKNKTVEIEDLTTHKVYKEKYDKLVLSPGASPLKPPIPGINGENIFTLRNVEDTDKIKNYILTKKPKKAVIVGAGFIGLEMAENLSHQNILVTIVEMADQVMNVIDYEMAAMVHQHLKTKNVEFYLKDGVSSFLNKNDKVIVKLNSGREITSDFVILSIGVKPEIKLAKECGLEIGSLGGISVNEYMQTSDPDIYALGDAVEVLNPIINKKQLIPLAGPANKQGRIVADNIIYGNKYKYKGTIGTAIAKVFDITVASTGASEKLLKRENVPYLTSITHSSSHAGYYPDALPMSIKLLFSPSNGRILGAQIIGYEGVDKRIDVIATLIKLEKTIYDLEEVEHAYAPPYSSAKDPVNVAAFVAENILTNKVKVIQWYDLLKTDMNSFTIIDVRTSDEFKLGAIENAINIPVDNLRERLKDIPKNKKIVVYCGVGLRAYIAARILMNNGFNDVYNLSGGYKTYEHVTKKQSNEDIFEKDFIGKDNLIYQYKVEEELIKKEFEINACGLQCPGPIVKLKEEIEKINNGERIIVKATDPGFYNDVKSWCNVTGNTLISLQSDKGIITAIIEKSSSHSKSNIRSVYDNKTMVIFSDDFDRALASFVIANGAASMGKKVTMFFTFWGLNIIKKRKKPKVKKDLMGKMFGLMLPKWSKKLKLSKMNMGGLGTLMMRMRMKQKNIDSLEEMIELALKNNIELVACQMSMDVMGVKKEELIDGVKIGGVATYLEETEKSNLNLFI
ncbi:MAG TPA: FAD-dependent oxidoreductase [Spirochaetota bacterium]|nr:FAD-dependent oxidoreductase [Spirochaetota bacterium]HPP03364.1 FAD-dependent oxidoreductase [Spirochaetota bacterium]